MSKLTKEQAFDIQGIARMELELQDFQEEISKVNPVGEEANKYTYLTYRIEILKRDIQIAKLQQPAIQKAMLAPMPPIYITQPSNPQVEELFSQIYEDSEESAKSGNVEILIKSFLILIDSFDGACR